MCITALQIEIPGSAFCISFELSYWVWGWVLWMGLSPLQHGKGRIARSLLLVPTGNEIVEVPTDSCHFIIFLVSTDSAAVPVEQAGRATKNKSSCTIQARRPTPHQSHRVAFEMTRIRKGGKRGTVRSLYVCCISKVRAGRWAFLIEGGGHMYIRNDEEDDDVRSIDTHM